MKIITVDAGKFNGKGMMDNERMLIRTKLQKVDNQIFTDNSNSFKVNWKGVDYLLGDCFTKRGVRLLLPFSEYRFRCRLIEYGDGLEEYAFMGLALLYIFK